MEIRHALSSDLNAVMDVATTVLGPQRAGPMIRSHVERHHLLVANEGDEVVGVVAYRIEWSEELTSLTVATPSGARTPVKPRLCACGKPFAIHRLGGTAMGRFKTTHEIRRLIVAVMFAVTVTAPHAVHAGPWVLWVHTFDPLTFPTGQWQVVEEHERLTDCRESVSANAQAKRESYLSVRGNAAYDVVSNGTPWDPKRPSLTAEQARDEARRDTDARITARDGYAEMKPKAGKRLVFDYVCLPDTVKAQ